MNRLFIFSTFLAASLAYSSMAFADSDVTAEQKAQNTPSGWTNVSLPQIPTITKANTVTITDFGASTSSNDNTAAIQKALDAVPAEGGMVVVPKGTWLCGPIMIKAKTVLHLAKGATLKLLPLGKYPGTENYMQYTTKKVKLEDFINLKDKTTADLIIEGEDKETSVIDGQGAPWWALRDKGGDFKKVFGNIKRGAIVRFDRGSRFLVRNLTVQNAPGTNITCGLGGKGTDCTIHDVIIREPASELQYSETNPEGMNPSHNTDGIPVWASHVNIYNCDISNGDDNVVIDKNGQYVHVWNCKFGTGHGASVGSYTQNVKHIIFDNITMNGTASGVRLKTGINSDGTLRGGGEEDFVFSNITMTNVKNPFSIDCYYDKKYTTPEQDKANTRPLDSTTPTYNGILLKNIKTTDVCKNNAIFLYGRPESHIKNITLDNVQISAKKGISVQFVDNLRFINGSKITVTKGDLWLSKYDATISDECGATLP